MNKKLTVLLVVIIMMTTVVISAFATMSDNGKERSDNGADHRARPAEPGEPGSPAEPAVTAAVRNEEGNLLQDPSFQLDFTSNQPDENGLIDTQGRWLFFTNNGGAASIKQLGQSLKIRPENVNAPDYGIQLIQAPMMIENRGTYEVTITAKSESPRNIAIKVGATGLKGWTAYSMENIALTEKMTTTTYEFTMYGETDDTARFELFLAQDMAPVWIDHVSLKKVGEVEAVLTMEDLLARTKTEDDEDLVEQWELVWADEFNETTINMDNWSFEIGNGAEKGIPGWGNGELEYYTDSSDNAYIDSGSLVIQALEEKKSFTVDGTDYTTDFTSARLVTENKVNVNYGRIEANILLPKGQGVWSAFWMLGADIGEVGWPNCGEIDILEYIGSHETEIHGTVHGPASAGPGINWHLDEGVDYSKDYHVYAIEWDADEVEFYVDDILYHIVNKDEVLLENGPQEWVYDHDHYLILNLAIGGNWPGAPDATTTFPQQMKVDYIRYYKDVNDASIDGEEVIDTIYELPPVTPGIDAFTNGSFEDGMAGWTAYYHFDAAGLFDVENGEGVFTLENDGEEDWSAHIYQGPFKLDGSKTYELCFDARADIPRKLLAVVDNAGYYRHINESVNLTETMTHYSLELSGIDEDVTIKFLAGELGDSIDALNHIYLDNITLREKQVTYTFDEASNQIDSANWMDWDHDQWSGPGDCDLTVDNGDLAVVVNNVGGASYSPQVYQEGFSFVKGDTYKISFDAMALAPKKINVNIGKALANDPWWTGYAPTQTYTLTSEMQTYAFTFQMTEETYDMGKLVFELGLIDGDQTLTTIQLHNIKILTADSL